MDKGVRRRVAFFDGPTKSKRVCDNASPVFDGLTARSDELGDVLRLCQPDDAYVARSLNEPQPQVTAGHQDAPVAELVCSLLEHRAVELRYRFDVGRHGPDMGTERALASYSDIEIVVLGVFEDVEDEPKRVTDQVCLTDSVPNESLEAKELELDIGTEMDKILARIQGSEKKK